MASRWKGTPLGKLTSLDDVPDFPSLARFWSQVEAHRDDFFSPLTEGDIERELLVSTSGGASYRHRFSDMFRHVVNHSSYHRGQLVTMLRQLGVAPPATDLIRFYRERSR